MAVHNEAENVSLSFMEAVTPCSKVVEMFIAVRTSAFH
jgi:hypothetical protein